MAHLLLALDAMELLRNKARATFEEDPLQKAKPRILVMDGSEHIRTLVANLLSFYGYEVTIAAEGGEVLALFRQSAAAGRPFDAIILDRSAVHGLGALETIEQLLSMDPHVKAIISCAFLYGPEDLYQRYGFLGVLTKPFTGQELQQAIAGVLAQRQI